MEGNRLGVVVGTDRGVVHKGNGNGITAIGRFASKQ